MNIKDSRDACQAILQFLNKELELQGNQCFSAKGTHMQSSDVIHSQSSTGLAQSAYATKRVQVFPPLQGRLLQEAP
jgi:hypothetical protein